MFLLTTINPIPLNNLLPINRLIRMAEKKNMRAPSGVAGLVRYDEEDDALLKLKPTHVVVVALALIIMEILFLAVKV